MHTPHSLGRYVIWLALLAVACLALAGFTYLAPQMSMNEPTARAEEIPPYTEEIAAQLAASIGFAALVSYTDAGFEPQTVTVKAGEAVRFTNNSSREMWVAASTEMGDIYPGTGTCGQSPFDICKAIGRGMFYEFTFEEAGTWGYHDNSDPVKTGVVVAE